MGTITFIAELMPYLLSVAQAGGDIIEAINWGDSKAQQWKADGVGATDEDIAELRARRHANDEIIARG